MSKPARPNRWPCTVIFSLVLIVALVVAGGAPRRVDARTSVPGIAAIPAGMPSHFSFGIMDGKGGVNYLATMRAQSGTAWDYHYAYLSAGVNTGHGWATWNSPAGQYAANFMHNDQANGFLPAFVYYMMLQSSGAGGNGEAATDLAHLAAPALMNAYYADWTLLMQKVGANGGPVLVVVEPDLWGYIEQAAAQNGSNSAASVAASVNSSGNADAQGMPDTAQGFAWALLRIRDHYAPKAILALHSSSWGTRTDVAGSTNPSLDAAALGTQEGQFLQTAGIVRNLAGISSFDLITNDIADHDSGQSGYWWDKNNIAFPNFARYLQFIHALGVAAGRHVMMWQVPVGNQYYTTENNTTGHTQDNRAEYIFGHIPDFATAGVIGVLFGPGNGGTNVFDNQGDGVTNPAPINTYECQECNSHPSAYADDDGGYMRLTLGQYYKNGPYPLSGGAFTPPHPPATAVPTATVAPTATVTSVPTQVAVVSGGAAGNSTATSTSVVVAKRSNSSSLPWLLPAIALLALIAASVGVLFLWRRRRPAVIAGGFAEDDHFAVTPDHWGNGVTGHYIRPDVDETWVPADTFDVPTYHTSPWQESAEQPWSHRQPREWE